MHTLTDSNPPVMLFAAVLAGGRSSRMGADKRFLMWSGQTWIERAMSLAARATGCLPEQVLLCGDVPGYRCIPDEVFGLGPLGGILAAVRSVLSATKKSQTGQSSWILFLPVDMPQLNEGVLLNLVQSLGTDFQASGTGAVGYQGFELPVLLHCSVQIERVLCEICAQSQASLRSVRLLLAQVGIREIELDEMERGRMENFNSQHDLDRVLRSDSR